MNAMNDASSYRSRISKQQLIREAPQQSGYKSTHYLDFGKPLNGIKPSVETKKIRLNRFQIFMFLKPNFGAL